MANFLLSLTYFYKYELFLTLLRSLLLMKAASLSVTKRAVVSVSAQSPYEQACARAVLPGTFLEMGSPGYKIRIQRVKLTRNEVVSQSGDTSDMRISNGVPASLVLEVSHCQVLPHLRGKWYLLLP